MIKYWGNKFDQYLAWFHQRQLHLEANNLDKGLLERPSWRGILERHLANAVLERCIALDSLHLLYSVG